MNNTHTHTPHTRARTQTHMQISKHLAIWCRVIIQYQSNLQYVLKFKRTVHTKRKHLGTSSGVQCGVPSVSTRGHCQRLWGNQLSELSTATGHYLAFCLINEGRSRGKETWQLPSTDPTEYEIENSSGVCQGTSGFHTPMLLYINC